MMLMSRPRNALIACLAVVICAIFASKAMASVTYMGQTWNVFKSTGRLGQIWDPSMVSISGNTATIKISGNKAGGIGSRTYRTYGTYEADFKFSKGAGKMVMLLYGKQLHQEIDFAESPKNDPNRTYMTATLHYGAANHKIHFKTPGNFSTWHHVKVSWHPGVLTFYMDGKVFGQVKGTHVPNFPMHQTIQTAGANVAGGGADAALTVTNMKVSA